MQMMTSTIYEIRQESEFVEKILEHEIDWHRKVIIEKERARLQFEDDDKFYFDKKSWNKIREGGIIIKQKGVVISCAEYKQRKRMLLKEIKID
jgi:hypothetical protein